MKFINRQRQITDLIDFDRHKRNALNEILIYPPVPAHQKFIHFDPNISYIVDLNTF